MRCLSRIASIQTVGLLAVLGLACQPSEIDETRIPQAEAYENPSQFAGEWVGESNAVLGSLKINALGLGRYYGQFIGDDQLTRFVLNLQQPLAARVAGADEIPGNLATFTWQDGRGGKGDGWVLINPEDSALTGEIRIGSVGHTMGFVRIDGPEPN